MRRHELQCLFNQWKRFISCAKSCFMKSSLTFMPRISTSFLYQFFFFFCQIVHKIKTQPLLRCIFFFNCVLLPLSVFMAILWCIYLPLLASWFHVSHLLSFRKLHLVYMVNNILLLKTWSSLGSKLWKKKLFVWLYRILWHT